MSKSYSKEAEARLAQMDPDRRKKWETNPMVQYIIESVIHNASTNNTTGGVASGGATKNDQKRTPAAAPASAPATTTTPVDDSSESSVHIDGPISLFGEDDNW